MLKEPLCHDWSAFWHYWRHKDLTDVTAFRKKHCEAGIVPMISESGLGREMTGFRSHLAIALLEAIDEG